MQSKSERCRQVFLLVSASSPRSPAHENRRERGSVSIAVLSDRGIVKSKSVADFQNNDLSTDRSLKTSSSLVHTPQTLFSLCVTRKPEIGEEHEFRKCKNEQRTTSTNPPTAVHFTPSRGYLPFLRRFRSFESIDSLLERTESSSNRLTSSSFFLLAPGLSR